MNADQALGLAQILLGLLLFTLGIPALIIEIRVDESLRRLLHKRIRPLPMIVLGIVTLALVIELIGYSEEKIPDSVVATLKTLSVVVIGFFAVVWFYIYMNVRISLVVKEVVGDMKARLKKDGRISDPDLADLLMLGDNSDGSDKTAVMLGVGELTRIVQERREYKGTGLEALIRGLPRMVERNGTLEHHNRAIEVIRDSWQRLSSRKLFNKDVDFIDNAACALGGLAVSRQLESVALRWISLFPIAIDVPLVANVPYRIGAAAVGERQFAVGIAALNQLTLISHKRQELPKEFIALVAHFHAAGPSAGRRAREFVDKLGYSPADVRMAAENAVTQFRKSGDYATADVIGEFLSVYP